MSNFIYTWYTDPSGAIKHSYMNSRTRGSAENAFFNSVPPGTTYAITWPAMVAAVPALSGLGFISVLNDHMLHVDFERQLMASELEALTLSYLEHIGPVPL